MARGQRGVITYEQLRGAGFSPDQITHRVKTGWLTRLHEGVYAIGTIGAIGRAQAALIACGKQSVAIDETSAALHDLLPYPAAVYVAVPRNGPRPPGVMTSRPKQLPAWILRHGLHTATVPETLLQLARTNPALAREATDQAYIDRRTDTTALTHFLNGKKGSRGVRTLRRIVEGPRTRSGTERKFFALLKAAKLPLPLTNVKVNGALVDFYWPEYGLIIETDGWGSHGRRGQWERDHDRDLEHFATSVDTLRLTARQVDEESYAIVAALAVRLRRGASVLPRATAAS
jgi:very-short-patch-repair endonuclease